MNVACLTSTSRPKCPQRSRPQRRCCSTKRSKSRGHENRTWTQPRQLVCGDPSRHYNEIVATAEQLKALVESYTERDDERFISVALQVAAHSAKQGHVRLARELRELVEKAKSQGHVLDLGRRP